MFSFKLSSITLVYFNYDIIISLSLVYLTCIHFGLKSLAVMQVHINHCLCEIQDHTRVEYNLIFCRSTLPYSLF